MLNSCYFGDCRDGLRAFREAGIRPRTVVTSPPYYGLRDYGHPGQLGLERTPDEYIAAMVDVFRAVRDVLADDGTLWLNIGDSYANDAKWGGSTGGKHASRLHGETGIGRGRTFTGLKPKDLIGIPWMLAFALRADGWYLRQDIIWHKPNPMPESVRDRCTKAHEYLFLLSKSERYCFDSDAIAEGLTTNPKENYPTRAKITGRGNQGAADARGNDRDKSGGFPPKKRAIGIGDNARPSKAVPNDTVRPQLRRAIELFDEKGLTQEHMDAIRTCGITDTGKARITQTGTGSNTDRMQTLAAEAKQALGGYYREFLIPDKRNRRSVWTISTTPYRGAHFATFPPALVEPCILAGSRPGDVVLDPFLGSGTTARVAMALGRQWIGCEINPEYKSLQDGRTKRVQMRIDAAA